MSTTTHAFTIDDAKAAIERAIRETQPRRRKRIHWNAAGEFKVTTSHPGAVDLDTLAALLSLVPGSYAGLYGVEGMPLDRLTWVGLYARAYEMTGWMIDSQSPTEAHPSRPA